MKGRRPLPTEINLARGNRGHRPINTNEPKHATIDATVPAELTDAIAIAEWSRLIDTLSTGHVLVTDRATLIGYCEKYATWRHLEAEAKRHPYVVKAPSGYPIPNPALGMANTAYKLMLRAAVELGLTPSSRSRVVMSGPKPATATDEFSQYQQARSALKRA